MATVDQPLLDDIAERVKAKENARQAGLGRLADIKAILDSDPAGLCQEGRDDWISSLDLLTQASVDRKVQVGVMGETGLGKSSLLNAILRSSIVPTSQSEACTATVCVYRFNNLPDSKKVIRARVTFKSWDTVEAELDSFKVELKDVDDLQKEDDEGYENRLADVNLYMRHVRSWTRLTDDEIRSFSPKKILASSGKALEKVFKGGDGDRSEQFHEDIEAPNREIFGKRIQPFIDSSSVRVKGVRRYWPVVEKVEIFLKSDILEHGLQLVDLPGTQDAIFSRGQVAETYQCNLDKRIVVTPAMRAVDNKAAADLMLSKDDAERLDMEGLLRNDSLCVAITKVDDIDCNSASMEFGTKEITQTCKILDSFEAYEDDTADEDDKDYQDNEEETTDVEDEYEAADEGETVPSPSPGQKRSGDVISGNPKRQKMDWHKPLDLTQLSEGQLRFHLKFLCVQARNRDLKRRAEDLLRKATKQARKGQSQAGTLPYVFPVSSRAFQDLQRSAKTLDSYGFPTIESTGIPDLESWLRHVVLPYREDWVDSDIHHIQVLLDAAHGWVQDDNLSLPKFHGPERINLEMGVNRISLRIKNLVNARIRTRLQSNLIRSRPLRASPLVSRKRGKHSTQGQEEMDKSLQNLTKLVKSWELKNPWGSTSASDKHAKTHWATFKACVRRHGGVYKPSGSRNRGRLTIHWMGDVQHAFWRGHQDRWRAEFATRLPSRKAQIHATGHKTFEAWVKTVYEDHKLPEAYQELIRANMFRMNHIFEKYLTDVRRCMTKFLAESREKKLTLNRILTEEMHPGFEAAAKLSGKGIKQKQMAEVKAHADRIGKDMFERARNEVEDELAADIRKFSKKVGDLWTGKFGCGTLIERELMKLSKRLSAKKPQPKKFSTLRDETKTKISDITNEWRDDWHQVKIRLPQTECTEELEEDEESEKHIKMEEDAETGEMYEPFVMVKTEPIGD